MGGLCVNGYFVCVGLRGKIWWGFVGAVPVCPPASPYKGASIVHSPCTMRALLVWKRRCANVRAGTQAPPLRFRLGRLRMGGWFRLGGLCVNGYLVCVGLRGKILRSVVGAVPMCPPVSPCRGAFVVHVRAQCVYFWYGNAAARAFGRARRHRPYGFVWVDCAWDG